MNSIQFHLLIEIFAEVQLALYQITYILLCFTVGMGSFIRAGHLMPEQKTEGWYFTMQSIACGLCLIKAYFEGDSAYIPQIWIYNFGTAIFWYKSDIKIVSILTDDWRDWIMEEKRIRH